MDVASLADIEAADIELGRVEPVRPGLSVWYNDKEN
jgi:hypothetical protein